MRLQVDAFASISGGKLGAYSRVARRLDTRRRRVVSKPLPQRVVLATVGAIGVIGVLSAQQTPPPTFRSGVRLVEVDVTVRDKDDRFIETLTKDDFEVLEDGVPREIQQSWVVNLPAGRKTDPTEATASPLALVGSDAGVGRLYVLVLADGGLERVKTIARQFITASLGLNDLMAVVHAGSREATPFPVASRFCGSLSRRRRPRGIARGTEGSRREFERQHRPSQGSAVHWWRVQLVDASRLSRHTIEGHDGRS